MHQLGGKNDDFNGSGSEWQNIDGKDEGGYCASLCSQDVVQSKPNWNDISDAEEAIPPVTILPRSILEGQLS